VGGYHPTFLPEEALEFADAVVEGDAESVWEQVVADARRGRLERRYRRDGFASLENSRPDRSIFAGKRYAPMTLIQYGRGCRYNCDFCSIRAFYGANVRQRPVDAVVDEIARVGRRHVFFVDDNLFVDAERARALFEALMPLRITWSCQLTIDVVQYRDLVSLMAKSGCLTALIGFESLTPTNLAQMRKGWNLKHGGYEHALHVLGDAGIMVYGTFVFGYDHDTVDSFDETVEFAIRNRFCLANFNPLTPTPGAPLFERLGRERRLVHARWWLDPGYRYGDATFHPRGMTAPELTAGCYRARTRFNTYGSIVRRSLAPRTTLRSPRHFGVYLLANVISRREIHAKQGRTLGAPTPLRPLAESG
jgi:radical SAM superfamily enzyme YgiQ (UPF0313 family)